MRENLHVDVDDHVAVVQPGVTLQELAEALAGTGLRYPVYPGELSGSIGGNVSTNAGGMRAVRHGVTRNHVLGLELVMMDGTVLRSGGPVMKNSTGYDLTQLVIGSEGTLAMVTEVTLRLSPTLAEAATVLVPFENVDAVTSVVPRVIASGIAPSILEYLDVLSMGSITRTADLHLAIPESVSQAALAYLVIVLETRTRSQLDDDIEALAGVLEAAGALDLYVLPEAAAASLIEARERVFWVAKAAGANDIIDIVVPRSKVPTFLALARDIAERHGTLMAGCGHVGDGNVHLSIYQPDEAQRRELLDELFRAGASLGGQISGEHGIGRDKQAAFLSLTDPASLSLQRAIKAIFDPQQLLNPYRHLDERSPT
jgi:glycolate oxidase